MFLPYSTKFDVNILINNIETIRNDYLSLQNNDFYDYTSVKYGIQNLLAGPDNTASPWQVYPLIYKREPWQNRNNKTIEILNSLDVKPIQAAFSNLAPRHTIDPHEDHDETTVDEPDTTIVKYHITLNPAIDGESALIVGNEKRILKAGDINVFDESVTHWVYNTGTTVRGVLLVSFLRKDLY